MIDEENTEEFCSLVFSPFFFLIGLKYLKQKIYIVCYNLLFLHLCLYLENIKKVAF